MKHIDFENFKLEEDKTGGFDIIKKSMTNFGHNDIKNTVDKFNKNVIIKKSKQPSLREIVINGFARVEADIKILKNNDKVIFERLDKIEEILERNNIK
jgi:hypothetical protein